MTLPPGQFAQAAQGSFRNENASLSHLTALRFLWRVYHKANAVSYHRDARLIGATYLICSFTDRPGQPVRGFAPCGNEGIPAQENVRERPEVFLPYRLDASRP